MRIPTIKWAVPHCYALIFFIIVVVAVLTWCIPSGSFDYHAVTLPGGETKSLVVPGSYHVLEKATVDGDLRQGLSAILAAPIEGIIKALLCGPAPLSAACLRWRSGWQAKGFW